ncbi:hypothetical protein Ddye_029196 [Dipteronia dyeriana]|uniref:Uncharacterized protein n=1 Tax=Dipteronia dyeriana TaxID=168575 RepID=A0AAD9TDZ7_9ROSI|nr:hypothetical protein Ddye_029196 [Dipteronia dyeriana]
MGFIPMKYMKPYMLYKEMEKMGIELLNKDAIGVQFLGLNILPNYFNIAISNQIIDIAKHHGSAVIGCPDTKNMENLVVVKVKSFVYELYNTGKIEGLKYTYWDRRIEPEIKAWLSKDPDLPDDHPNNTIEDYDDRLSVVYILQSYLDRVGKR